MRTGAMVEARILDFLKAHFVKDETIDVQTSLFLSGMLDSMSMLTLLSFIEESCNVTILGDDFSIDKFDTVRQIADYVSAGKNDV
jgi:acyl carrier protein